MTPSEFVTRALSVPFVDGGRDWEAWDCWGLVVVHHREVLGIRLPTFDGRYETAGETANDRAAISALVHEEEKAAWRAVERPSPGDVLVLRMYGRPVHVGVVVDPERFLHAEKDVGTVVERLSSPLWARRLEGVYRYVGRARA